MSSEAIDIGRIGEDVPLLEGIRTTRAIRRLRSDPVPRELLRKVCEAGTFTRLRLRQKFLGHAAMRREVAQGNNPLKIPSSFQILHVSKTEKRTENVWKLAQQMKAEGSIPPDLHWFTSEERYLPDALFTAIWRTPANDQAHSIVKQ